MTAATVANIPPVGDEAAGGQPAGEPLTIRPRSWIKRMLPQTMVGRSLLLILMALVLVQIPPPWVFPPRHWETGSRRLSADTAGDIGLVIDGMKYADTPAELTRLL